MTQCFLPNWSKIKPLRENLFERDFISSDKFYKNTAVLISLVFFSKTVPKPHWQNCCTDSLKTVMYGLTRATVRTVLYWFLCQNSAACSVQSAHSNKWCTFTSKIVPISASKFVPLYRLVQYGCSSTSVQFNAVRIPWCTAFPTVRISWDLCQKFSSPSLVRFL